MSIQTINPTTGEMLETFEAYSQEQINQALDLARQAFLRWHATTFAERAKYLQSVASHLRDHKTELARIAVLEMGKSIGPVAAVIRARNADHALELANDSKFGLSSNLWTRNIELGRELAARIEAGGVFING